MASLYKRGKRYYVQFELDGFRRVFSVKTTNKRIAIQRLRRLVAAYEEGIWDPTCSPVDLALSRPTAPRSLEKQVDAFLLSRSALRPRTQETYRQVLELCEREGGDLRSFLAKRRGATQVKYYRHLRVFYNWLLKQGWLAKNPCDDIALPRRPQKEAHFFSLTEIEQILLTIRTEASYREQSYLPPMITVSWRRPSLSDIPLLAMN